MPIKYYIGTSGWNYDSWRGSFYPKELAKTKWLKFYAEHFNTIEINATFYRFFKDQTYLKWFDEVPANFRFVLKAPKLITHYKLLRAIDTVERFDQSAMLLKNKLGLILLQLAPQTPYELERLQETLNHFSNAKKIAVEFRDNKWMTQETKKLLLKYGSVYCAIDSPDMKIMNWLTSDTAYIRLHGHKAWYNYNYSLRELKQIAKFAKGLSGQGAKKIYIFFNNDWYAYAPYNALTLKELLE